MTHDTQFLKPTINTTDDLSDQQDLHPGNSPPASSTPEQQRELLDRMARETSLLMGLAGVLIVAALIILWILLG